MTAVFGATYAEVYDLLYADKDYEAECDLIAGLISRYGSLTTREILDLGCGTGRHAVILTGRGFSVTGVDRSEEMLALARERAGAAHLSGLQFLWGDVRSIRLRRQFDAVLLMFAVLGYQLSDSDLSQTLDTASEHLKPGGLAIFDVWYGPAVEALGPTERVKVVHLSDGVLERRAVGRLEPGNLCTVEYDLRRYRGNAEESRSREAHRMRYFFPEELRAALQASRFDLLHLSAFPSPEMPLTNETWNALVTARRLG